MNRKRYKIIYNGRELFKNQFSREIRENEGDNGKSIIFDLNCMKARYAGKTYQIIDNFQK